ncbi:hypothetical protein CWI42_051590 [Ordospora colligata]|uniref:Uncharacterized protein n=1 Tax=Ordospora colligata OC4 TaxID=1354746 RepID=A0A0B2ULC9_9MICR|nr:uncharacterized protein M896_051640 [Ordospora colligata OC4]KHN69755.1 hypothetical protein M896_051640 [Ordospora colligata OC4]TBU15558.1 hypothetical protein CWI41_051630 [Ordospora colligata]TBU15625.1 hypothetical protein CWI40_051610 [Ordospora colligata]TBU18676.1 hypothetical protein CWI42_051590 [Ordospora colligata]
MKSLELTVDNINAVSIEMARNKEMLRENVNHLIGFMLQSFPEKNELLSKIKVLNMYHKASKQIDTELDVMDQIALNVFTAKDIIGKEFNASMIELFKDPSTFSRAFVIYFFKNWSAKQERIDQAMNALSDLILSETGLKSKFYGFMSEFEFTEENAECEYEDSIDDINTSDSHSDSNIQVDCENHMNDEHTDAFNSEDSEEINKVNQNLSVIFKNMKKKISSKSLVTCVKVLDAIEAIIENNVSCKYDIAPVLMFISCHTHISLIFKRSMKLMKIVFKHRECTDRTHLFEMFCSLLQENEDMVRMTMLIIDVCKEEFDWTVFFRCTETNKKIDLGLIDRKYFSPACFYEFLIFTEFPERYLKLAKLIIKNESDIEILKALKCSVRSNLAPQYNQPLIQVITFRINCLTQSSNGTDIESPEKRIKSEYNNTN